MSHRSHTRHGFSLIEMSIVLAIVALVMGFGVTLGSNAMKSADRVSVQQKLGAIQSALENYVATNGYLPCPAQLTDTTTANLSTFGVEQRNGTLCLVTGGILNPANAYIGMVPVRTLGLPDSYAGDPWGNKLDYAVSFNHVTSSTSYNNFDGSLIIKSGDRTGSPYFVSSRISDRMLPNTAAKITYGSGATYVVVSHGPDGHGAYAMKSASITTACGSGSQNDVENCNGDVVFWDTTYNDNATNAAQFFDDFIVWGSNANRRAPINTNATSCSGSCEAWCAPCAGTLPNTPPDAPGALNTPVLCQKIITSTAPCAATCVWSGTYTAANRTVRCP